jgi:hypothetical protein
MAVLERLAGQAVLFLFSLGNNGLAMLKTRILAPVLG